MNYIRSWFETDPERLVDSIDIKAIKADKDAIRQRKLLNTTRECVGKINDTGECYVSYNADAEELFKRKGFVTEKVDLDDYDKWGDSWTETHLHVKLP